MRVGPAHISLAPWQGVAGSGSEHNDLLCLTDKCLLYGTTETRLVVGEVHSHPASIFNFSFLGENLKISYAVLRWHAGVGPHQAFSSSPGDAPEGWAPPAFGKKFFPNVPFTMEDAFHVAVVCPVLHYCMGGLAVAPSSQVIGADGPPGSPLPHRVWPPSCPIWRPANLPPGG